MNTSSILVVDRNEHSRTALVRTLEQAGYRAKGFETGGGMLAVLGPSASTPPYGLVLLDWDLPKRSVHEVLCRLRDQHLELPVIVLIEQSTPEQVGSAIHLGAAHVLEKPVSSSSLTRSVSRVLSTSMSPHSLPHRRIDAWIEMARRHLSGDDHETARRYLGAAIAARPSDPELHTLLGILRAADGEDDEARVCFERALTVDPDAGAAQAHLDQLEAGTRPILSDEGGVSYAFRSEDNQADDSPRSDPADASFQTPPASSGVPYRILLCISVLGAPVSPNLIRFASSPARQWSDSQLALCRVVDTSPSSTEALDVALPGSGLESKTQLEALARQVSQSGTGARALTVTEQRGPDAARRAGVAMLTPLNVQNTEECSDIEPALSGAIQDYGVVCVGASRRSPLAQAVFGALPERIARMAGTVLVIARSEDALPYGVSLGKQIRSQLS